MLLYSRLKVYELRKETNFWITASTNGESTRLCPKRNDFCLFGTISCVLDCDWWIKFLRKEDKFPFSLTRLVFFAQQCVPLPTKNTVVGYWSSKSDKHVRGGFALFAVVKIGVFVGWKVNTLFIWACWIIHVTKNILDWFLSLFNNKNHFVKFHEKRNCLFFKKDNAHLTHVLALRTLIVAGVEGIKKLFRDAKFLRTQCSCTIHVSNRLNIAIDRAAIKGECATSRKSSQKFWICCCAITVLVQLVSFAIFKVDNFCKYELNNL